MKEIGTSENYQNQNLKQITGFARFLGKEKFDIGGRPSRFDLIQMIYDNSADVTREILELGRQIPIEPEVLLDSNQVFIVHGHDTESKFQLARLIEKDFKLKAIILHEEPDRGNTIIEKLERVSQYPGYVFVLLTPDDIGTKNTGRLELDKLDTNARIKDLESPLRYRARQNVILELGFFMSKVGRNRLCCLYKGNVEIPSDIFGVLYLEFKESITELYGEIKRELTSAGMNIKLE